MKTKKILFATVPFDGHFSPLTGLAVHLLHQGYDVRWYAQDYYAEKLQRLGIPHYPFVKAVQFNQFNLDDVFPQRNAIKNPVKKLNFDIQQIFIARAPEYYADLLEIQKEFDFDMMVADFGFTAIPFVTAKMLKPVINISVVPLPETSRDLAPSGLGMTPAKNIFGKMKQSVIRYLAKNVLFKSSMDLMVNILGEHDISTTHFLFDDIIQKSTLMLQSGTPSFEYERSDMSPHIHFIGPLLPAKPTKRTFFTSEKMYRYNKIVLVTQGTVEKDVEKILVPTLEAFKDSDTLVIATTGGSKTAELRGRYPQDNYIIEDFIPFADVMPECDVYISNGGYGGVLLSIENEVPMVVAGVHEGKNEICARVGYFELGINLKTEYPQPRQIRQAVETILKDKKYYDNTMKLAQEFRDYEPNDLFEQHIEEILGENINSSDLQKEMPDLGKKEALKYLTVEW